MKKNNFPATVVIVIIFFGAILLLSGLCTGMFAVQAGQPGSGSYWIQNWYEAVFIGSFALIPSSFMLWAAIRQIRRGNNKVSGVIFLIAGILSTLFVLFILTAGINSYFRMLEYAARNGSDYHFSNLSRSLLFTLIFVAIGAWLIRVGIKIVRHKSANLINPETFD